LQGAEAKFVLIIFDFSLYSYSTFFDLPFSFCIESAAGRCTTIGLLPMGKSGNSTIK